MSEEKISKNKEQQSFSDLVKEYNKTLSNHNSAPWDKLPDIDLYMDQVVTFLERELDVYKVTDEDKIITSSMINNYTKDRVVPRANKKKYSKEHIGLMLMVFSLKKVLSMPNMSKLLSDFELGKEKDIEKFYNEFLIYQNDAIESATLQVDEFLKHNNKSGENEKKILKSLALKLAVSGQINCILSEHILNIVENKERE